MPDFSRYLSDGKRWIMGAVPRAVLAWKKIQDAPTTVTLIRNGVALAPQMFRVDTLAGGNYTGEATSTRVQGIVLLGIREYPDLPDTDVRAGDRFVLGMSL